MTTKKQAKEEAERAALLQRVSDIWTGADGGAPYDPSVSVAMASMMPRWLGGLQQTFDPDEYMRWAWGIHNLASFATPEDATEMLFERGVRANLSHLKEWRKQQAA